LLLSLFGACLRGRDRIRLPCHKSRISAKKRKKEARFHRNEAKKSRFLPVFLTAFFFFCQFVHSSALRLASDDDEDDNDDEDDDEDDEDDDDDAAPRRRRAGEPALFKKPLPIQSLATPMALSDDLLHDDEDEFDEPPDFTPDSSPARRFRRVPLPLHQQQLWWHRLNSAGDVSAPTSSPMSVRSSSVNPISQQPPLQIPPQHSVGSSARACPPTPSPVRVAGEFRRPRAGVIVTLTDAAEPSSDLLAAEENAIADRQALEQLTAAGHGHGGASTRLFAATLSDKRPPPSPRYRAPRSPALVRRRAVSQAQPVLSNPFSPARRRAQTDNSSQHSCEQAATSSTTAAAVAAVSGGAVALALGAAPTEPLSRYHSDFTEQGVLGTGVSSVVYKASNNTDGWVYAIKVKQGAAHGIPRQALNEMFALAALGSHVNVIRYYNAWIEEQCLYLQCEFCSGGSVEQRVAAGGVFSEPELCVLFRQMAGALAHIHAHELVHLDVKPENMFIATGGPAPVVDAGASLYKLGDLGLISAVSDVSSFEDGDSRYLPTELLNADATASAVDLTRADVFSLGASIYELARRRPLPARDAEWHEIRRGNTTRPAHISAPLFELIVATMDARVARRPSAADLLQHRLLLTPSQRQIEELTARVRQLEQQLHHHHAE